MAEGDITIMVGADGAAGIPHELASERAQRLAAQEQLAAARLAQLEQARLAAKASAQTIEQQRQAAMAKMKESFEEGDWGAASETQARLAELAVAKREWESYAGQVEQSGNTEAAQEKWLKTQHPRHQAWIRSRPEFFTDAAFQKRCVEASSEAVRRGYEADDPRHHRYVEEAVGLRPRDGGEYSGAAVSVSSRQSPLGPATHRAEQVGGVDDPNEPRSLEPRRPTYAAPPTSSGRDFSGVRTFADGSTTAHLSAEEASLAKYMFPDVSESQALVKYAHNKKLLEAEGKMTRRRDGY